MSYGFELSFIPNVGELKAYRKAQEIVNLLGDAEIATEYIKNTQSYSPVRRHWLTMSRLSEFDKDVSKTVLGIITEHFLSSLFNLRFVYWPEHKLLGCCFGDGCPEEVKSKFRTSVYFQNSCDQDYDYAEWKKLKVFKPIVDEVKGYSKSRICAEFHDWGLDPDFDDFDYYRRSLVYARIFAALDLDAWLYGRNSDSFFRFAMSPLVSSEKRFQLEMIAKTQLPTLEK